MFLFCCIFNITIVFQWHVWYCLSSVKLAYLDLLSLGLSDIVFIALSLDRIGFLFWTSYCNPWQVIMKLYGTNNFLPQIQTQVYFLLSFLMLFQEIKFCQHFSLYFFFMLSVFSLNNFLNWAFLTAFSAFSFSSLSLFKESVFSVWSPCLWISLFFWLNF